MKKHVKLKMTLYLNYFIILFDKLTDILIDVIILKINFIKIVTFFQF